MNNQTFEIGDEFQCPFSEDVMVVASDGIWEWDHVSVNEFSEIGGEG